MVPNPTFWAKLPTSAAVARITRNSLQNRIPRCADTRPWQSCQKTRGQQLTLCVTLDKFLLQSAPSYGEVAGGQKFYSLFTSNTFRFPLHPAETTHRFLCLGVPLHSLPSWPVPSLLSKLREVASSLVYLFLHSVHQSIIY